MSFKELDELFGSGQNFFLSEDGDTLDFVPVGEPWAADTTDVKGNEKKEAVFAVVSDKGFGALPINPARYRQIRPLLRQLVTMGNIDTDSGEFTPDESGTDCIRKAIRMTRRGAKGKMDTIYELALVTPSQTILDNLDTLDDEEIVQIAQESYDAFKKSKK